MVKIISTSKSPMLLAVGIATITAVVGLVWFSQRASTPETQPTVSEPAIIQNQITLDPYDSMLTPLTGTFNEDFEKQYMNSMLTHQAIAIAMAKLAEQSSQPAIQELSRSIIQQQGTESATLRQLAQSWGYELNEPDAKKIAKVTESIRGSTGIERDQQFTAGILDHAGGSVSMAKLAVINSKHSQLKDLAQAIVTTENTNMTTFEVWAQQNNMIRDDGSTDAHSKHDQY